MPPNRITKVFVQTGILCSCRLRAAVLLDRKECPLVVSDELRGLAEVTVARMGAGYSHHKLSSTRCLTTRSAGTDSVTDWHHFRREAAGSSDDSKPRPKALSHNEASADRSSSANPFRSSKSCSSEFDGVRRAYCSWAGFIHFFIQERPDAGNRALIIRERLATGNCPNALSQTMRIQ